PSGCPHTMQPQSAVTFGTGVIGMQAYDVVTTKAGKYIRAPLEMVVGDLPIGGHLPGGGHWTRDIVFSKDGSKMFVSVGSQSNDAMSLVQSRFPGFSQSVARHGFGAIMRWVVAEDLVSSEEHRADVVVTSPAG